MKNVLLIVIVICINSCRMPADPLGEIKIIKRLDTIDTGGNCLDIDVSDSILVAAANYNGFIIFNLYDSSGNFNPKQKYHGSDLDPNTFDNQISKVMISDSLSVIVLMDKYDKIYVNRLNGSPIFYLGGGVNDCYGGAWTDFSLDESSSSLRLYTMVDHNLATEYDVDENSKSLVWQNLEFFSSFPTLDEIGSINCEFSLNLSDEAENIHFSSDGLFTIGLGELGIQVYKQLDHSTCYKKIETEVENRDFYVDISDINISGWNWSGVKSIQADSDAEASRILLVLDMDDEPQNILNIQFYDPQDNLINMTYDDENNSGNPNRLWFEKENDYYYIKFNADTEIARFQFTIPDVSYISLMTDQYFAIDEFNYTDNYDDDKSECEKGSALGGYGGIYEPAGGISPNLLLEFDTPGEINSVYSVNHSIFTGLSNSNGLLVTNINEDGSIIYQEALAQGYSVNDIFVNDNLIGLAVGHDGALIYSWDGNTSFILKGRLETSYANAIKINDNVIYIATEDGIEVIQIDR